MIVASTHLGIIALVVAGVGLAGALVKFATTMTERQKAIKAEVAKVHILVNNRMEEAIARIDQLIEVLQDAGVAIPEKPEKPGEPS